jgi:peptidyl-prolyl cis-trans isomerase C
MHLFPIVALIGFLSPLFAAKPASSVVARVNGEAISEEDLSADTQAKTREERIRRAIQYRLILQEAKRRGLDKSPDIQEAYNALLYKKFIEEERVSRHAEFNPTEEELKNFYNEHPLIRIRHLVLPMRSEAEKQVGNLALEEIKKELKKGTSFAKLCVQYSQDPTGPFGGDTDFRGPHNFPEDFYNRIFRLKKNEVSEPIEVGSTLHLFQWFDSKPFTAAPASYLQFLQARLSEQKEKAMLTQLLKTLESSAVVQPQLTTPIEAEQKP